MCAGNDFVLLLTNAGHVYSLGTGTRGELGVLPMIAQSNEPRPVEDLMDAEIHVSDIACGGWHTLALTCRFLKNPLSHLILISSRTGRLRMGLKCGWTMWRSS